MPQTSPMNWMIMSLVSMNMVMSSIVIMNESVEVKFSKKMKSMNSMTMKWSW
uniref:ATP synthase F0 subunit 8 n=1 Tax=Halotydeus destructor TaxID=2874060 RepID=UPI002028DD61|nr:ATP synthase F0 subunit 8 [Halotydeus destructor]UPN63254.1 ATP synthase subunit 8 [Halotydeus destructor]